MRRTDRDRAIMRDAGRLSHRHVVDLEPEDPSQLLDDSGELHVEPLDVEARPEAENLEDLDIAESTARSDDEVEEVVHGTGELYGVRTPYADDTDRSAAEDRDSFEGSWRGETWLESLEEHAIEMGPAPEEEVVIVDDSDVEHDSHRGHHPTEGGDPPVADRGAGGPGGL
jgi:hypothetical protein